MANGKNNDDFWDLGDFKSRRQIYADEAKKIADNALKIAKEALDGIDTDEIARQARRAFSAYRTSAVEINDLHSVKRDKSRFDESETVITKFVPPHSSSSSVKKHVLFEYEPQNPLIKSVTVYSEKEGEELFVSDNLFIRERRALLRRAAPEREFVPFYSYSPRYSQLNKAQLGFYLWWRENARNGIFLKTDESYILLYAYELAATGDDEDKEAALASLCSLLTAYSHRELQIVHKMMIRDIICDFCLIHRLPPPVEKVCTVEKQILFGSFLPEFFIDLSQNKQFAASAINTSLSLYDFRRSKCYNDATAPAFKKGIIGALHSVINDDAAFESLISFTRGVYGNVTAEHHPFTRMVNIVNKNIKIEVSYYELGNLKTAITDIVRYSENKVREHLGIKSRIHVLSVNSQAKAAIDAFFEQHMPPMSIPDKRRRENRIQVEEKNEYDALYDIPKVEISPERALEIERESWDTTKILVEAFEEKDSDKTTLHAKKEDNVEAKQAPEMPKVDESIGDETPYESENDVYSEIYSKLGKAAEFLKLCFTPDAAEQKKFAQSLGLGVDAVADRINECAVELFGDIFLESDGSSYTIIEDYLFLFKRTD